MIPKHSPILCTQSVYRSLTGDKLELEYGTRLVNVAEGEQFDPEFVLISPNSKVPVLVDHQPEKGGEPITLFEAGAIMLYLAEKHGRYRGRSPSERAEVLKWLFWHCASQSPMNGQCAHFNLFRPDSAYARDRYKREARRLAEILDRRLGETPYVAGQDYSIADMACFPWFDKPLAALELEPRSQFPNVSRWFEELVQRPAIIAAIERYEEDSEPVNLNTFAKNMFGQDEHAAAESAANAQRGFKNMGVKLK